jgi:HAD superfamily hydrolase (TIGR01509 family)
MIKGVIFDLDGLLIDSEKIYHRVSYQMARKLGADLHDGILAQQMGRSPLESMEIFKRELGITKFSAKELVDWRDQLMLKAYRQRIDLMPYAQEIIFQAAASFKTAIATGSTRILVDVIVEKLNLKKQFDLILPSDEVIKGKPNPEIYLKAARTLNLDPKDCVVLEDSSNGSMAGFKAGCRVIAVPNEYTRNQDFSFTPYVVNNLLEAWEIIRGF